MKFDRTVFNISGTEPVFFIKNLLHLFGCRVDLHKMVRADAHGCFHSHPAWAVRIILRGGYVEEMANRRLRAWRPLDFGIIAPNFEHRIDALRNGRESWSLWLRGPVIAPINTRGC